jgi:hypothetical protein
MSRSQIPRFLMMVNNTPNGVGTAAAGPLAGGASPFRNGGEGGLALVDRVV